MSKLKVDILLPYKEKFNLKNSGAIANIVYELVNESNYKNTFRIFGSEVDKPLLNKNFVLEYRFYNPIMLPLIKEVQ